MGSEESQILLEASTPQAPASAAPAKILVIDERAEAGWHIRQVADQIPPGSFQFEHADRLAAGLERLERGETQAVVLALTKNLQLYNLRQTASFELVLSIGKVCFDPAEPLALEDLIGAAGKSLHADRLEKLRG
jgi:hypothetical protein